MPVPTHVSTGLTLGQHWELRWAKLSSSSNFAGKSSSSLVRLTSDNLVLICYFECLDINQIVAPPHVWTLWWQAKVDTLPTCTLYLFIFLFHVWTSCSASWIWPLCCHCFGLSLSPSTCVLIQLQSPQRKLIPRTLLHQPMIQLQWQELSCSMLFTCHLSLWKHLTKSKV